MKDKKRDKTRQWQQNGFAESTIRIGGPLCLNSTVLCCWRGNRGLLKRYLKCKKLGSGVTQDRKVITQVRGQGQSVKRKLREFKDEGRILVKKKKKKLKPMCGMRDITIHSVVEGRFGVVGPRGDHTY